MSHLAPETSQHSRKTSTTRIRLMGAAASIAIAGAVGFGAVASGTLPVQAEAVRVENPQAHAPGFADVVERVSPAVVSVRVKQAVRPTSDEGFGGFSFGFPGMEDLPNDHPMKRFFREFRGAPDDGQQRRPRQRPNAQGSGFFISEDGYLVTNNHVVDGGEDFTIVMDDGTELDAKLIGSDPRTDLAVLKVEESRKFAYVAFADDTKVRVGDWVVAVGNPFGLGGTVTAGIVSARGRDIGAGPYDDFFQIDAAVNRGNSGGPTFNLNGEVVGVNTAIFSPSGGNVGIAFAIPASTATDVVDQLIDDGQVERGWLGVQIQPVTDDIAESLGLESPEGALVAQAQADTPAEAAGIRSGDVITGVDGQKVNSPRELARRIASIAPGQEIDVELWRGGKAETMKVKLGEIPADDQQARAVPSPASPSTDTLAEFGLTVARADDGNGLVVTQVEAGSAAEERGIQAGDVITQVNATEVNSTSDVEGAVSAASKSGRKAVLFQITREGENRFVALPVDQG